MYDTDRRFWPFSPRTSIISTIAILLGLLLIFVALRVTIEWPSKEHETKVLIGMLLFSLLPIMLALVDVFIERGGVIEYRGIKIDFSQVSKAGRVGIAHHYLIHTVMGVNVTYMLLILPEVDCWRAMPALQMDGNLICQIIGGYGYLV